jgi:hypothetical protein
VSGWVARSRVPSPACLRQDGTTDIESGLYYNRRGEQVGTSEASALILGDRHVARTHLVVDGVPVIVSTVHLVFDHQYSDGPPLIFETMVFGVADDNPQWRYSTEEEAKLGHQKVVELLRLRVPDGLGVAGYGLR